MRMLLTDYDDRLMGKILAEGRKVCSSDPGSRAVVENVCVRVPLQDHEKRHEKCDENATESTNYAHLHTLICTQAPECLPFSLLRSFPSV